jgi:radical SAM protein with 4Fe4S-binding SPASM domain
MKNSFQKIRRHWRVGFSYVLGMRKSLAAPITVHIETTNICNFRCIYCPQSQPESHFEILGRGKMELDDFKKILDKILSTWNIRELVLTRDGEPLVHPRLHEFIAYAAQKNLDVTIGSNGSYFSEARVVELLESGLTKVKGDFCVDRKKYEQLRAGGKWDEVLQGYTNLLDYTSRHNSRFHLVLVDLNTYDLKTKKEIRESLHQLRELFPYPEQILSVSPALMHNSFDEAKIQLTSSQSLGKPRYNLCHHPWIELVIDYKGNAVGCCRDLRSEYIIGNVLQSKNIVAEIWNGPKMQHLRQQLASRNPNAISTCSKCDLPYGISYAGRGRFQKLFRFLKP